MNRPSSQVFDVDILHSDDSNPTVTPVSNSDRRVPCALKIAAGVAIGATSWKTPIPYKKYSYLDNKLDLQGACVPGAVYKVGVMVISPLISLENLRYNQHSKIYQSGTS